MTGGPAGGRPVPGAPRAATTRPALRDESRGFAEIRIVADLPRLDPPVLFAHWTEPDLLASWWPSVAEVDAREGGSYHFAWPAQGWDLGGRYTRFDPVSELAFTWRWDHEPDRPERTVRVAIELAPVGGSLLRLVHGTYSDDPADRQERAGHVEGWLHFLARLATVDPDDVAAASA